MPDPLYNDISRQLRRIATDLDAQASTHRRLADQLDHLIRRPDPAPDGPQHLVALDAAAMQFVDLPAADIRRYAAPIARAHGQQVLPVAIRAQHLRRAKKERRRRVQTIKLLSAMAQGVSLKDAAAALGISEATGRRLRDLWRDQGKY